MAEVAPAASARPQAMGDQLKALHRPGLHLVLGWQIAENDRAAGALLRQLSDVHLVVFRVVIEMEADLVAREGD